MKYLLLLTLLLPACDEVIDVRNAPPEVTVTALCEADGRAFFLATVRDLEGQPIDVDLVVDQGGARSVIAVGAAGDGATGLSSSEAGVEHRIEWGAPCAGAGCVDLCADRTVGPSGLSACAPAPAPLPDTLDVTFFATDGKASVSGQATVPRMSPLPVSTERVAAFFALRARWAGTHNLSGPRALAHPHLVDLADAEALATVLLPDLPLVDVGAGSGVPGLLIACLDPARAVIVVEPITKRAAFLRTAAHQLGLARVQVERARWPLPLRGPAQVVSRAVVSPEDWPGLAAEGGEHVVAILRYLAAQRPPVRVPGFEEAAHHDYAVDGASRRVERWDRV